MLYEAIWALVADSALAYILLFCAVSAGGLLSALALGAQCSSTGCEVFLKSLVEAIRVGVLGDCVANAADVLDSGSVSFTADFVTIGVLQ